MEDTIFTFIFVSTAILIIAYLASLQAMFRAAKKYDPEFFQEMDFPHLVLNNKLKHTPKILKALLTFRYRDSSNKKVKAWGNVAYILFVLIIISFGCLFYVA